MRPICIYASDLAVAIGVNKYQKTSDVLVKLWQKNYPINYENAVSGIKNKHRINVIPKETDYQCVNRIQQEGNIDLQDRIQTCLNTKDTSQLLKNRSEILDQVNKSKTIEEGAKQEFKQSLESMTNKVFGTINEKSAIDKYMEITGKKVNTSTKFIHKQLCTYNGVTWKLGGKIDGITDDKIVVEVKNRIYKLFNEMRDYEKPQIQTYMYILGLKKGHLVESMKRNGEVNINIIEEDFDEDYWNNIVLAKLNSFIKLFHLLIDNDDLKEFMLIGDENEKDEMINNLLN